MTPSVNVCFWMKRIISLQLRSFVHVFQMDSADRKRQRPSRAVQQHVEW